MAKLAMRGNNVVWRLLGAIPGDICRRNSHRALFGIMTPTTIFVQPISESVCILPPFFGVLRDWIHYFDYLQGFTGRKILDVLYEELAA